MKKIFSLAAALFAMTYATAGAADFTVLTGAEEILANSVEDVAGAKAALETVLNNTAATDAEKTAALQTYVQSASPLAGYAFDLSFLLSYNAVTDANKNQYTKTNLAKAWKCDVEGVVPDASNSILQIASDTNNEGTYIRIYDTEAFINESSYGKFILYQAPKLNAGKYQLSAKAFTQSSWNCVTVSAGTTDGDKIDNNKTLNEYSVDFTVAEAAEIKLGFKRMSSVGPNLNKVAFNDVFLYKTSSYISITDDATEALAKADGVNVILEREFSAGKYYPLCLPFIVENWRDVFDDVRLLSSYTTQAAFATITGANTQARKPYMVKFSQDITADNYLVFRNVNITTGNPGGWLNTDNNPIDLKGNWAAGPVAAGNYYFDVDKQEWNKSNGTEIIPAFSAYLASTLTDGPDELPSNLSALSTSVDIFSEDSNLTINVCNLQGMIIKRGVKATEALDNLPAGIYIVNGKKIVK